MPELVDTGAAVTIVNAAAFRRLGWAANDPRLSDGGAIRGASAEERRVLRARIGKLSLGRVDLTGVPVMMTDDDQAAPAIILGNDILNLFTRYAVDFARGELQISVPHAPNASKARTTETHRTRLRQTDASGASAR